MMKKNYLAFILVTVLMYGCKKENVPLPDNTVKFTASEIGISPSEGLKVFTVNLDQATTKDVKVQLSIAETGVIYDKDYTTTPAAVNGQLSLTIPVGKTEAEVTINKKKDLYDRDDAVLFTIISAGPEVVLGAPTTLNVKFQEIISEGSKMTLNGGEGGANAENMVYVDLSNNTQTAVPRQSWNLGLYCGDKDAIKLNNATTAMATQVEKGYLGKIMSEADVTNYKKLLQLNYTVEGFKYLDSWDGDITKTVVKEGIEYVMNPGGENDPLYIIQVDKKDADTYIVRYSKVTDSSIHSIEVKKNKAYNYQYVSFASGNIVSVEPPKGKWDILYGKFSYFSNGASGKIPYNFSDLIFNNSANGVETAEIKTAEVTFDAFGLTNIKTLTFSGAVDAIGAKWRVGGGPGKPPTVKQDIFYVIKDVAGNYYKLRFLNMSATDGGVRGKPEMEYKLIK